MAVQADVQLHSGTPIGTLHYFRPSDVVAGMVEVTTQEPIACRSLDVRLIWFTEGACEENVEVVTVQRIAEGSLPVGQPIHAGFAFQLPPQPWSYNGMVVSIVWAIEVLLDLPLQHDPVQRARFMVRPSWVR